MSIFSNLFGDANERFIKGIQPLVDTINSHELVLEKLTDADLKEKSRLLKQELISGKTPDDILPEAFALVREAARRTLKQRHFDVQLMGGIVLHKGMIAEMRTGEGKTLVATLPAYLNALTGRGVHIVTVNDYLARRDAVWMGQIYNALGLTVGCINHEKSFLYDPLYKNDQEGGLVLRSLDEGGPDDQARDETGSFHIVQEFLRPVIRREAYAADITYGTNNEFGFDYLRDNMVYRMEDMSQLGGRNPRLAEAFGRTSPEAMTTAREAQVGAGGRGHYFAIVDEVDSILIDEARTPLIISAPDAESPELYKVFAKLTPQLKEGGDYKVDKKYRAVQITEEGIDKVEKVLGIANLYEEKGVRFVHHLEQSLRAQALFYRDKDYVVKNGEVIIVDEFTGRMMPGRRWSDGLHQAVEAKEGVDVKQESRTLATITFQNYFRLYQKLSGMTGTAQSSAEEFHKVYNIDVISIPTHRLNQRTDFPDLILKTENGKFKAVVEEIKKRHPTGQPILVGTVSIHKNETLSGLLRVAGISHEILNAKNHEKEGEIIAQAGRKGAVTIATNMAGRGVDIILGGNPPDVKDAEDVRAAGGLHVLGTERHEARRIDNQLRGRAARQGDPGSSQFFVSLEDDLMRIFGGEKIKNMMEMFDFPEDMPLEHSMVSKSLESAQQKIEGFNFDTRKHVLEYDDVINKQRTHIYAMRREILLSDQNDKNDQAQQFIKQDDSSSSSLRDKIFEMIANEAERLVGIHVVHEVSSNWSLDTLAQTVSQAAHVDQNQINAKLKEIVASALDEELKRGELNNFVSETLRRAYEAKIKKVGEDSMRNLEKAYALQAIDYLWMDHLEAMDHLRDSVRLRAYGQRDPLVEYKNEGIRLFRDLQASIQAAIVAGVFRIGEETEQPKKINFQIPANQNKPGGKQEVGRNDPCPCGAINPATSQVYKYKKCGLVNAPHHRKS